MIDVLLEIAGIIFLFFILSFSSRLLLNSFEKIAQKLNLSEFALSSFLIALGTSIPELVICIQSALKNQPDLAIGNVLGSNIANLSLIIGTAALIAGSLKVDKETLKTNIYYTFLVAAAPLILLNDKKLSRLDGLLLLLLYLFWQKIIFEEDKKRGKGILERIKERALHDKDYNLTTILFFGSLTTLLLSTKYLVELALKLAIRLNTPPFLIGVFLLGIGSSLPELLFEIRAIKEGRSRVALGNILGSVIANSSLILGVTVMISPLTTIDLGRYLTAILYFLTIFSLFFIFIKSKEILERWEGAFLTASYLILIALEFG